jgi:hypothetical protein
MYRFKTKEEFIEDDKWVIKDSYEFPMYWNNVERMNTYLGQPIPEIFNESIKKGKSFSYNFWNFNSDNCVEIEELLTEEESQKILEEVKQLKINIKMKI